MTERLEFVSRDIRYSADGAELVGRLVVPNDARRGPAVLVAHEGNGLSGHAILSAERLAALGYMAFAMDYFGGGRPPGFEVAQATMHDWLADPAGIRLRARAALDVLLAETGVDAARVAAVGYCYGGTAMLELGRTGAALAGIVGLHPSLKSPRPEDSSKIRGAVLMCVGGADRIVPPEDRLAFEREMTAAGVDWRMTVYGGVGHSFTNPDIDNLGWNGFAYDACADARSRRAMLDMLQETIGLP